MKLKEVNSATSGTNSGKKVAYAYLQVSLVTFDGILFGQSKYTLL